MQADNFDLRVKVFADGADLPGITALAANPLIRGFTTNPTLMRAAGVSDYEAFAHDVLGVIEGRPISFEVFSDEIVEMERQAVKIAGWGDNIYVKIPVTNTRRESTLDLVSRLAGQGVKVNLTAVMTPEQVKAAAERLAGGASSCISVFAGRIADTGRDPVPIMRECLAIIADEPQIELIWASPREVLNIFQADAIGCHIITVTHDLLKKLGSVGRDLEEFSLDTVRMFHRDAAHAGYRLD